MLSRILRSLVLCGLVCAFAVPASSQPVAKRPITHADYASWRSIGSPVLSPDGNMVVFALAPQDGEGEVVLRHLSNSKEYRHPRGSAPTQSAATGRPGRAPAVTLSPHRFSGDGKFVVFPVYPSKADKTKGKAPVTAEAETTAALGVMETASGKVAKLDRVRTYQLAEDGTPWLAYAKAPPPAKFDTDKTKTKTTPKAGTTPTPTTAELVLRNLADGKERSFDDVSSFTLTKDGRCLVFAVASRTDDSCGVFAVTPGQDSPPQALRSGPGRYAHLTWDEKQSQLVFDHSLAPKPAKEGDPAPKAITKLYHWQRPATGTAPMPTSTSALTGLSALAIQAVKPTPASELVCDKPALLPGHTVSDQDALTFSPDGSRVYFSVTAPPAPKAASAPKASVELWHYQDEFIQPMQKARYSAAPKTYRAVFSIQDRESRQLADESMTAVAPALTGDWALGSDDRAYRHLVGSVEMGAPADVYLVNQKTGTRKLVVKKNTSTVALSPAGKYLLSFDGKDWNAMVIATGKSVNLTKELGVRFDQEVHDVPSAAPAYGFAGWTKDDKHVLVYDRFDVWMLSPDGAASKNVTAGLGRKSTAQLRIVRLDSRERSFDPAKPLLVRAENETTRDTGFYRITLNGTAPKLLIMARNYSTPVKASKGEKLLLTVSTFYDAPDLFVADPDFREVKRITDANPQKSNLLWGKAELVKFTNSDGVSLQAMLVKPENFDPKKKYPMMVYIYERLSQNLHSFSSPRPGTSINPTYYASNGYLVLMPDITYTVGHPGQSAVKCVLPAIQAVVDKGCVNEKAIGIQGHSWGGYQTAYLITQTNRFAAASAGAPVSNMTSAYGGIRWGTGLPRQFQYEKTQSRIGDNLWQAKDKYLENSPLFHADRIKTPLLMLHNDRDEAVPWQQGIEYYLALRRLNKEVYLFNYPGEAHGLTRRVNQEDYTVRLQQFFDHHLKGAKKPEWMEKGIAYTPPPGTTTEGQTRTGTFPKRMR